jgi:ribonuclease HI
VYCDGAWGNNNPSITLWDKTALRSKIAHFTCETDKCTNNIAEYEAILLGLRKLWAIGVQTCVLRADSMVVSGHTKKECIAREPTLEKYLALVWRMENYFTGFIVEYIEQSKNTEADDLVKAVARNTPMPPDVFYRVLEDALVKTLLLEPRLINIIKGEDWRAPMMAYLRHYYELDTTTEKIRMQ